jgi:hypothetical protein
MQVAQAKSQIIVRMLAVVVAAPEHQEALE